MSPPSALRFSPPPRHPTYTCRRRAPGTAHPIPAGACPRRPSQTHHRSSQATPSPQDRVSPPRAHPRGCPPPSPQRKPAPTANRAPRLYVPGRCSFARGGMSPLPIGRENARLRPVVVIDLVDEYLDALGSDPVADRRPINHREDPKPDGNARDQTGRDRPDPVSPVVRFSTCIGLWISGGRDVGRAAQGSSSRSSRQETQRGRGRGRLTSSARDCNTTADPMTTLS